MSRPPDPAQPGSPPQLQRGKRAAPGAPAQSAPPPPPGTEVGPEAAMAAALPWDGDLAETSPLRLMALAAAAQATGRLLLHGPRASYTLFFRRGTAEHASSSSAEDDLGRFLVARGAIDAGALAAVEQERAQGGADLVGVLASRGVLNPAQSFPLLAEHAVAVLARAAAVEEGRGFWEPNAPLPASAFPLGPRFGLLCDAVRRLDPATVGRRLGDRLHRVATRVGGRIAANELRLSAIEARVAAHLDGAHSIGELAAARPAEAAVLQRVALLLAEAELLAFGAERPVPAPVVAPTAKPTPTPTATAAPPEQAAGGGRAPFAARTDASAGRSEVPPATPTPTPTATATPTPTPTATATAKPTPTAKPRPPAARPAAPGAKPAPIDLRATAGRLAGKDHFEVLGVGRDAQPGAVKAAYFALAKQVHPDIAPPGESPELRQLRADVFARVSEAWAVLSDPNRRAKYLEELAQGAAVDVAHILEAEELFTKATILVKTRQYPEALAALEAAERLNPEEPEFRIWRAWIEFLVAPVPRERHAKSAAVIEKALATSPLCAPGYLFLGQMAKITGDLDLAERHLKRGLQQVPEHPELTRELKYLRK